MTAPNVSPRLTAFAARFSTAGGEVVKPVDAADLVRIIADAASAPEPVIAVSPMAARAYPDVARALRASNLRVDDHLSPETVRHLPIGLTCAEAAIAESGSLLLVERDLADRVVSMLVRHLFVLCSEHCLVDSLPDAAPLLRTIASTHGSFTTLVSGPSRTADIERELAIGVQGPARITAVFLGPPLTNEKRGAV